ncbi:CP family cyanate transporter-like MFS transporter [Nocardioides cavernae]|uniref:CP family cyanate transporter-like MFS transporter n=1 Tax=Nocardioides cavernae TaxID=1921566 RepID=A0A7Y9H3H8_9ACTN|nr:MFS transporter [Nocardioides cavernae]NYE37282.1 CP family cyanate transporter-like MFS transporter [Nocardioides cavernae]
MTTLTQPPPSVRPVRLTFWAGVAIAVTAVNLRTAVTGFSPLLETIGADLGFGVALIGLLGTVPAATFGVFGFLAPTVTRRFGLERTAAAALALTALSLVLRSLSPAPWALVLSTVLALAGIGAANVVIVPLVKAWFAHRLALWTSFYLLLLQTGQFVAPLMAVPVEEATSWRVSAGIWAVPAALAAVLWLVLTTRLPADHHAPVATTSDAKPRVSRSSTAWGLMVLFAMVGLSNYAIITWVPSVITDAGGSTSLGGTMVGLYSAWGVLAALVVPQVATRVENPFAVVVACSAFLVLGYVGLAVSPLDGTLLWVCALGIGVSSFPLCLTLINRRARTPQSASALSGFVQGIGYGVACVGPVGLGLLRESTGSWTAPLVVLAATTVPAIVAGWYACRPRYVDDAAAAQP